VPAAIPAAPGAAAAPADRYIVVDVANVTRVLMQAAWLPTAANPLPSALPGMWLELERAVDAVVASLRASG